MRRGGWRRKEYESVVRGREGEGPRDKVTSPWRAGRQYVKEKEGAEGGEGEEKGKRGKR